MQPKPSLLLRQITLDWHELAFIGCLALVTPCFVTVAPALAARRVNLTQVLSSGTARTGAAHTRTRQALVVAQLALAVMLTIVGSLFTRSAHELLSVPVGFDTANLVTFVLGLDEILTERRGPTGRGAGDRTPD